MDALIMLWLPVALSAAGVWIASSIVWMLLPYHKNDFKGIPDENAARDVLRDLPPGQYNVPHMRERSDCATPEGKAKFEDGPVIIMNVMSKGVPGMGKSLGQWFLMTLVVSLLVAYVVSRGVEFGASYMDVFTQAFVVSWLAYGMGLVQKSIWFGTPWSATAKQLIDAAIYAGVTAGFFGWLWPAAGA